MTCQQRRVKQDQDLATDGSPENQQRKDSDRNPEPPRSFTPCNQAKKLDPWELRHVATRGVAVSKASVEGGTENAMALIQGGKKDRSGGRDLAQVSPEVLFSSLYTMSILPTRCLLDVDRLRCELWCL